MKVLITGAGGQLGRSLLASAPAGATCHAFDRSNLDLADQGAIERVVSAIRPDLVINAAAYTAVDRAEGDAEQAFAVNARAPEAFARSLAGTQARLVQISTDFVFDGACGTAYKPEDRKNPQSVYGLTKSAGEDGAGPEAVIVRTSWVYGAGGNNFVRTMLRLMQERDEIRVVADQIGSPTWVGDLARTVWALAARAPSGIYHHRDAGIASWYDFATAIAEEGRRAGLLAKLPSIRPISSADYPTPAKRPPFSVLDVSKTRELLGDAHVHWRTNLIKMLEEEKTFG